MSKGRRRCCDTQRGDRAHAADCLQGKPGQDAHARARAAERSEPDFESECSVCESSPVVPETGMCGPCTFGEADTAGGNW